MPHFRNSYLHAMPRIFPLRTYDLPDIGDHLIHFTGRTGARYEVPFLTDGFSVARLDEDDFGFGG